MRLVRPLAITNTDIPRVQFAKNQFITAFLRWPFSITFELFMLWRPFFARVKTNYRSIFFEKGACCCHDAVAMATGLVKNKALITVFVYFKKSSR